jgi:uncharacterized 2Fe-2S/4Fe-4S cluster protein (DUF4445 family)
MSKDFKIDFEPIGRHVPCRKGTSILEVARDAGLGIASVCGGKGTCGKCKIRVTSGKVSLLTEQEERKLSTEEIAQGYRLACMTKPCESIVVHIPPECLIVAQRLQVAGKCKEVVIDPIVKAYNVTSSPPNLGDLRADQTRILDYLAEHYRLRGIDIDLPIQRQLPGLLRSSRWQTRVGLRGREVVKAGSPGERLLGLAIDIGTTKLASYLTDLQTGEILMAKGAMNGQIAYGEDVVSRLNYAMEGGGEKLRQVVTQDLNQLISALCAETGCAKDNIVEAVIVGNTAMHHLFLGLPARQLALSPYVPAVSSSVDIKARDLGLAIAPGAYIHLLPNIAGFVGADHVAMLLATGIYDTHKTVMGLDIGTNTEICLAACGNLRSCSCASGPAFEGAHIKDGMRATGGAIERIKITGSRVELKTINGDAPIGICGSGILDGIAQLLEAGIINEKGKMQNHPRVRSGNNGREFTLVPAKQSGCGKDITITEKDISEIQLAKAAISAGMSSLLEEANITWEELDEVIIAGAFGSYIDVASAIRIGMFPSLPVERFTQVGNAAGVGARLALVSQKQRGLARDIARRVQYVELVNYKRYPHTFAMAVRFPSAESFRIARLNNGS